MLLIIFGAGASYDALPDHPAPSGEVKRPPLANELFDLRFAEDLSHFPEATAVAPYLRGLSGGVSIEAALEELVGEATGNDERQRQLMAVRFYLQMMLSRVDLEWNGLGLHTTNYRTLLDEVRRLSGADPVAIVTFNYDRMVELCLGDMRQDITALPDYLRGPSRVFKVHGSVNWARLVLEPVFEDEGGWSLARQIIEAAPRVKLSSTYALTTARPIQEVGGKPAAPALAIPVLSKQELEMPEDHLEALRGILPGVTRVLVIGWKGADIPFRHELQAIASAEGVAVSPSAAAETIANLADCPNIRLRPVEATFTQYVRERRVRELFA